MSAELQILVVDDESSITVLCQHLLELSGYTVLTASLPADAFRILDSRKVDLLLTDIRLPEMDGFELIKQARKRQPELAVVVMTGYRTVETAIHALRSGVDGLVIKPYELGPELQEVVRQALESNRQKQSATSLAALEPLLRLASAPLAETSPQAMEKLALEAMRNLLKTEAAGFYHWEGGAPRLAVGSPDLPGTDDPLWEHDTVRKVCAGEPPARLLAVQPDGLLAECGWSSLALVSIRRRQEQLVFLAARPAEEAPFRRSDLDLLSAFARQASTSLENVRLFHRLGGIARRLEGSGGLYEASARMELVEKLMPDLIREVNNPLHAVKNNLYLAGRSGQPAERLQSYLGTAQQELYRLEMILQRILALAEPPCTDAGAVDVEQIITQALEIFQSRLKEQNIQVKLSVVRTLPGVNGARDALKLLVYLLLENAVEALSGQEGERAIWIEAGAARGVVQFSVEDSGPEVNKEGLANLFKPFYHVRPGESGLGRAACRKIVESHGGVIRAQSGQHGQGVCVQVELRAVEG